MPKGLANLVQPWPDGRRTHSGGGPKRSHCHRGHLLHAQTTYDYGQGRQCKQCQRERLRFYAAQRRLARMAGEATSA